MQPLPEGSQIQTGFDMGAEKLALPQAPKGCMLYLFGLFMTFFLFAMWGGAIVAVVSSWTESAAEGIGVLIFVGVWLIWWSAFSYILARMCYRIWQPLVPETLILSQPNMIYDSGIPVYQFYTGYRTAKLIWRDIFYKRTQTEITPEQIKTLTLHEFAGGNRLTIDIGIKRLDLGKDISEIEREWLYATLREHYGL